MQWNFNAKITNPYGTNFQNRFATHIDVFGDTLLIGNAFNDTGAQDTGMAFAYKNVAGTWTLDQEIPPPVIAFRVGFGTTVNLNSNQAAIYSSSQGGDAINRAIHMFDRTLPTWGLLQSIKPPVNYPNSTYFAEMSLLENSLVVLGSLDLFDASATCIFHYSRTGASWSLSNTIMISDESGTTFNPKSISSDGGFIVVGGLNHPSSLANGQVYSETPVVKIYKFENGSWILHQTITSPHPYNYQWMQIMVAVSMSAGAICVGWPFGVENSLDNSGSAAIYRLTQNSWVLEASIENPHPSPWAWFGEFMDLSPDRLIISAYGDDAGGEYRGAVYCYIRAGTNWILNDTIIGPPAPNYTEQFGLGVSISGDYFVTIDYRDGTNTEWQSVVYAYDWAEAT
jgi:hypothetical protein